MNHRSLSIVLIFFIGVFFNAKASEWAKLPEMQDNNTMSQTVQLLELHAETGLPPVYLFIDSVDLSKMEQLTLAHFDQRAQIENRWTALLVSTSSQKIGVLKGFGSPLELSAIRSSKPWKELKRCSNQGEFDSCNYEVYQFVLSLLSDLESPVLESPIRPLPPQPEMDSTSFLSKFLGLSFALILALACLVIGVQSAAHPIVLWCPTQSSIIPFFTHIQHWLRFKNQLSATSLRKRGFDGQWNA